MNCNCISEVEKSLLENNPNKDKVTKNHIYASFCPFCGKSAKKEEQKELVENKEKN